MDTLAVLVFIPALTAAAGCGVSPSGGDELVAAAGAPAEHPRPHSPPPPSSRILQGQVVAVDQETGQVEAAIFLQWAPDISAEPEQLTFHTDDTTVFGPVGGGIASLRPGEDVEVIVTPQDDGGWRAVEVVKIDLD